ncbi:MAG: pyridoxamine 5'-phosphate oxidase family protein [Prevotellaceae bacterium]|jgi:uncharacterized pyridoxamine 5'-phosphate oxidase family protein|nr:pyridoxamine 5'-phosphate oxidase family protein [Prevotellaceae bacterium]
MTKQQIFDLMNDTLTFHLATVENGKPHVRGMMLYKADETGIVFHTGDFKDVYKQIIANPNVEMCFNDPKTGIQVRVRGVLEEVMDTGLKDEISNHPTRAFLKKLRENSTVEDFYNSIRVFRMKNGIANVWTFDTNFAPKQDIQL